MWISRQKHEWKIEKTLHLQQLLDKKDPWIYNKNKRHINLKIDVLCKHTMSRKLCYRVKKHCACAVKK
jgi:hypothetical protein